MLPLTYFAGYVDADGYIRFNGSVRMEVKSVFPWILEEFVARFGGTVSPVKSDRNTWRWDLSGPRAEQALHALHPYLYVKKTQARLALEARDAGPGPAREAKVAEIGALKHCNYEVK